MISPFNHLYQGMRRFFNGGREVETTTLQAFLLLLLPLPPIYIYIYETHISFLQPIGEVAVEAVGGN